jgi:hypothetical protein
MNNPTVARRYGQEASSGCDAREAKGFLKQNWICLCLIEKGSISDSREKAKKDIPGHICFDSGQFF